MIEAAPYPDEQRRIAALKSLHLLDTPIEERFERITRMVCRILDVPIALFNLIDEDRQHYKSAQGLTATNASRQGAFCTHALNHQEVMLVPDARKDKRFHDNPFVTGERLNVQFYAGCPVRSADGMPIGTLCAIDMKPRQMTTEQIMVLRDLAAMLETELKVTTMNSAHRETSEKLTTANMLALVDPLTRIWNRAGIIAMLEKEWALSLRQRKPLTLVMADIDHFKMINDSYGHPAGDDVLRAVTKTLLAQLRAEDSVGRVGGEEFLMVLTDCKPERGFETAERLRKAIEVLPIKIEGGGVVHATISMGIATMSPEDGDYSAVIKHADEALYRAKNAGRNRIESAKYKQNR